MTITVCLAALKGTGKCWDPQCRLRHDVVHCKPCKCFVLHGELRKHFRGEDHRLKCGFEQWKANSRQPAQAILSLPYPYVPKPKPSEKRVHRQLAVSAGGVPARGEPAQHLSVSGEEGLDFKRVCKKKKKKTNDTIPVIIQKSTDEVGVSLTLVDVEVTGAGSGGFSAIPSLPMKIKGKKQRTIPVSFVPTAPGGYDARLVLRILHVSKGKRVTLAFTRMLHGVATSPVAKPRPLTPKKPVDINLKRIPGVRASQRHPGSIKNMQLRGARQHRESGRDSPRSH